MLRKKPYIFFRYKNATHLLKAMPDNNCYYKAKEGVRVSNVEVTIPPQAIDVYDRYNYRCTYISFADLTKKLVDAVFDDINNSPIYGEAGLLELCDFIQTHSAKDFDKPIKLVEKN